MSLWAALPVLLAGGQLPGTVIDQVVAVVDKQVITESELEIEARLALISREKEAGLRLAEGTLPPDLLASSRDYLINQILIANHTRRLGIAEVSEQAVDREVEAFTQIFPSPAAYNAFLRRYDIPVEMLRATLRRDLRNEAYIQERMQSWLVGGKEDGDRGARARQAFGRWLDDLRRSAEVRLLGPRGELELQ